LLAGGADGCETSDGGGGGGKLWDGGAGFAEVLPFSVADESVRGRLVLPMSGLDDELALSLLG